MTSRCIDGYRSKFKQENKLGQLICHKCEVYQDKENFNLSNLIFCINHRNGRDRRCTVCKTMQYNKRRENNRGVGIIHRVLVERWNGVKDRAKAKGYTIDFSVSYLEELWSLQNGRCAISGVNMTHIIFSGRVPTNVSVDRIESELPYQKGNIQLVCMAVNQMKSDLTNGVLLYFCEQIIKNHENKNN